MSFQATRQVVVDTCRTLADSGFLAGTGGNVALRADDNHLAITPSATDYYTMSPDDVCIVRLDDLKQVSAQSKKPSVEMGLHVRMLSARPNCDASIHTHQPIASAYSLLAKPLDVQLPEHRALLGESIPCAGYAPSGTGWLARKVARCVRANVHAYLMRNHGIVCVGADVDVAMQRVSALESACAAFFGQQLASHNHEFPAGLIEVVRESLASESSEKLL
jgi:L-fuculose-phosphate aldolase